MNNDITENEFLATPRKYFSNKVFDWFSPDTEENYNKVKKLVPYGPTDISYKYNSQGFRSDEFESWEGHSTRIVFAGCSHTEGIGLPIEDTWANIFHKKICNDLNQKIPFWNIAAGGTGLDHLVRYLIHYGDLLRPNIIISLLPHVIRRERWDTDQWGPWKQYVEKNSKSDVLYEKRYVIYQTEKNFSVLNLLLERWNSTFLFYSYDDDYDFTNINFPRIKQYTFDHTVVDYARDNIHHGPNTQKNFAEKFYQISYNDIKEKLNQH